VRSGYSFVVLDARLLAPQTTRGLRREEYDCLVALGVFEDERIELIEGELVTMGPNNPEHASPVQVLTEILVPALVGRATIRIQLPIIAVRESEPEPDVAIVPLGSYRDAHPAQAYCVVEVAHSSLSKDRNIKEPLYAASGFCEYWLVNVPERVVEVFRDPGPEHYRSRSRHAVGETITLEAFPDVQLELAKLF
jgi:Uma2 family endonuclease